MELYLVQVGSLEIKGLGISANSEIEAWTKFGTVQKLDLGSA
jgi:hypothetical protein